MSVLTVENLRVSAGDTELVHGVSFTLEAGERLGMLGGSGSGKTLTALAISGLLPPGLTATGTVSFDGKDVLDPRTNVRGDGIGFVFQEPKTALDPFRRLGTQMTASLAHHYRLSREERHAAALRLARRVNLADPERMVRAYPHEVSGGQRQRAAIAAALSAEPQLLIADEPTTALDVTVQRHILALFRELSETERMAVFCISHDIAAIAQVAHRLIVIHEGSVVETGSTQAVVRHPQHEITRRLLRAAGGTVQ